MERCDRLKGLILGTAVGDALGYPVEQLTRDRIEKFYNGRWRHRFLFGRGMVSDDTDHTVFVAQALIAHPNDVEEFTKRLARSLRWWLLGLPVGLGRATLLSTLRLWLGIRPSKSGVFSAGNGAAMRAAVIGANFPDDGATLDSYLRAQTILSHSDPKALIGARAVAYIAAWVVRDGLVGSPSTEKFHSVLQSAAHEDDDWIALASKIRDAAVRGLTVDEFSEALGLSRGVSGYVYHTVPVAVYAWFRHFGDFKGTLESVLNCGGDTDSTGAIAGALAGVVVGESGIPDDWLKGLVDWPRGSGHLQQIAERVCEVSQRGNPVSPVMYFWPGMILRNAFFTVITFIHFARRLFPPY